jgi:hypothetical protein
MKKLNTTFLLACGLASPASAQSNGGPGAGFFGTLPPGLRMVCTSHGKVRCCSTSSVINGRPFTTRSCATHSVKPLARPSS